MTQNSEATKAKRDAKRRARMEELNHTGFPRFITRVCKDCGKLKKVYWMSCFTVNGDPQYRARCHMCHKARQRKYCAARRSTLTGQVLRRKREFKERLLGMLGGACSACGYYKSAWALSFHHLDKSTKEFDIARALNSMSEKRIVAEVRKCILLCLNCHMEEEEARSRGHRFIRSSPGSEDPRDWDACSYDLQEVA